MFQLTSGGEDSEFSEMDLLAARILERESRRFQAQQLCWFCSVTKVYQQAQQLCSCCRIIRVKL